MFVNTQAEQPAPKTAPEILSVQTNEIFEAQDNAEQFNSDSLSVQGGAQLVSTVIMEK